ncbi:MAG: hypothetical protein AVDCRST_MAG22-916, partial [uncultured Rubrobacteraceae bacterium]
WKPTAEEPRLRPELCDGSSCCGRAPVPPPGRKTRRKRYWRYSESWRGSLGARGRFGSTCPGNRSG